MDSYKQFIFQYLDEYPDTPAAVMHDKLKERFIEFPEVNPKTVYNYVIKVRGEFNIRKVSRSERQYSGKAGALDHFKPEKIDHLKPEINTCNQTI